MAEQAAGGRRERIPQGHMRSQRGAWVRGHVSVPKVRALPVGGNQRQGWGRCQQRVPCSDTAMELVALRIVGLGEVSQGQELGGRPPR